jgi:hypothetical protein
LGSSLERSQSRRDLDAFIATLARFLAGAHFSHGRARIHCQRAVPGERSFHQLAPGSLRVRY